MPLMDLTEENFDQEIDRHKYAILDFWAEWCAPCKAFAPVFQQAAEKFPEILFAKIDTDRQENLARQFEIRSIPTLITAKDGEIVHAKIGGMTPPEFEKLIQELLRAK
jgi:thioredoxin